MSEVKVRDYSYYEDKYGIPAGTSYQTQRQANVDAALSRLNTKVTRLFCPTKVITLQLGPS